MNNLKGYFYYTDDKWGFHITYKLPLLSEIKEWWKKKCTKRKEKSRKLK